MAGASWGASSYLQVHLRSGGWQGLSCVHVTLPAGGGEGGDAGIVLQVDACPGGQQQTANPLLLTACPHGRPATSETSRLSSAFDEIHFVRLSDPARDDDMKRQTGMLLLTMSHAYLETAAGW